MIGKTKKTLDRLCVDSAWICLVGDVWRIFTLGFITIKPPFVRIFCIFSKHLMQIQVSGNRQIFHPLKVVNL